ncbi:hypothetical protein A3D78_01910 [Candidatus Gottesmanbacteria bacterium RIFCSPHIGHO2_02_FULL_39_14]|uniref:DUF4446 domain-containing protein n=3 Tax=Candidatus Gottesmaniibacteriota TaxID=1752720 RepID=A0A1F6A1K8_9BACT|nr:MAG: hypothetical protein A2153_03165 [Candidatus Gottesmanbacteria bacterium RBG_16_38_7b]OGG18551.1 MAG: hypothetical protein A3D78_01910 [Candidatus Gottesmanbacteria bacterium RIFCSPHIGHO2_02_FULL_39_14]OGG31547.1 MAG: hypothetical protein A3I51_04700 [Candidatus Gottesmanbacteria bacterium RIFCSPLOWO2_02_FULL_38_8]
METTLSILISIIVVYLIIQTVYLVKIKRHYHRLVDSSGKENLTEILDAILNRLTENKSHFEDIDIKIANLAKLSRSHIRKVGILRFNPFADTGGDQSFILSLLDETDSGVVLTSLHNRNNTRWYAKNVINGKGQQFDLTNEELKAIKLARSNKENKIEKT